LIDQEKIHKLCLSKNPKERIKALEQLESNFSQLSDKQQAWNDLIKLTTDKNNSVRFSRAASVLGSVFSDVPDKQQAWNDLIKLTACENSYVRSKATSFLGFVFSDVPDKQQAWNDLHKLTTDKNNSVRFRAASVLGSVFSDVPDKQQAWNDLHKLTTDKNNSVRFRAASVLGSVFFDVPDKQQAWNDLIKLITDKNNSVKSEAASTFGSVFSDVPDKQQAWNDLHKLTTDKNNSVRFRAASVLGSVFFDVPDKQQAWNDLHKLTTDKDIYVRSKAASTFGSVFSEVSDKQKVWDDLIKLTSDESSYVRSEVVSVLGSVFSDVPDKQKVWDDLIKLTSDEGWLMRSEVVSVLGFGFSDVPDKQKAWNDLIKLTTNERSSVRVSANHSLGKVSIFKASQAKREEDYKRELETAISFFEIAAHESILDNPAQFCLPFYRSFYEIISEKQEAKEEVDKYLAEAKNAVKGSKSKKLLFEVVNNLANALKEVQNPENMDLEAKKSELNFYRKYCDRAAELLRDTEEKAPFATITMRKGLPILDRKLKSLIEEIKEKANTACQVSQGTPTREVACAVNREVQKWEISSQEEMSWYVENLIFTLESTIPRTPKNQNFFDRISQIREEKDIVKQYAIVCTIIPLIPHVSMDEKINNMEQGIDDIKKDVGIVNENTTIIIKKLDEIQEELKKGFESLDNLSIKVGGTEGKCLKIFSEKLLEITKKGDSETLKLFLEEVLKNEDTLTREIESSSAPQNEKEKSKGSISKLKSLLKKVKNPAKEFGKDVTNEIVVSYTAKGIIELFLPIMSMAVFGVPIPSQIIDILTNVIAEIKN